MEAHLARCASCRREAEAFAGLGDLLRRFSAPDGALPDGKTAAAWIVETARAAGSESRRPVRWSPRRVSLFGLPSAARAPLAAKLALSLAVAAVVVAVMLAHRSPPPALQPPSWGVARLAGTPRCGSTPISGAGQLRVGQWLETDGASRAKIDVADIGEVDVEPNTRIRLLKTRPQEHRLELARGEMRARITAPPRLFFVETPSAVAVDLGCAYSLQVDDAGRSFLRVTSGWVALVHSGRESFVPAGARCETRPRGDVGTPYLEDAAPALREALRAFDFEDGGAKALTTVLATASEPDSLTVWHLLSRTPRRERGRVYDRLAALTPPPDGVTREGVLRLDPTMLARWREQIEDEFWSQDLGPIW